MRNTLTAAILLGVAATSSASAAKPLTGEQLALAMWVDAALFAAEKCPRTELIKENIRANLDNAGVTEDQARGDEWKRAMAFADMHNREGFTDDPQAFCDRMWKAIGEDNPVAVELPLLKRLDNGT
jgi:hypothetical protein